MGHLFQKIQRSKVRISFIYSKVLFNDYSFYKILLIRIMSFIIYYNISFNFILGLILSHKIVIFWLISQGPNNNYLFSLRNLQIYYFSFFLYVFQLRQ